MDRQTLTGWRNLAAWLGTVCLFLFLACLIDGSQAGGRKDPGVSELLPGQSLKISGPMPRDAEKLEHLRISSSQPELALRLEETYSGFWLGGQLWRAEVSAPRTLAPGDYHVALSARNETSPKFTQHFTVRVFPDEAAMDATSLSLVKRGTGASPFVLASLLLPLGVGFGALSTLLSRRLAELLRTLGLGQVFRVQKTEEALRVFYPLGSRDGLAVGDTVEFLDRRGEGVLYTAAVSAIRADDAESLLPLSVRPPLSALVRKSR